MRDLKAQGRRPAKRGARKKDRNQKRLPLTPRRLLLAAAGFFGALIFVLVVSGWAGRKAERLYTAWLETTAEAGFAVEEVFVVGRSRTAKDKLLAEIGVARGTPIFAIDPKAIKTRLEALPWTAEVTVERRLPNVLLIEIAERQPLALWQHRGRKLVIDRQGEVIPGAKPLRFAKLPLVVGEGAPSQTAELLAILAREPALRDKVTAAVRVGKRRWNLRLQGGIDVHLPETETAEAWSELARVEREHGLLRREILAIDLRISDRMTLRMAPGASPAPDSSLPGKET